MKNTKEIRTILAMLYYLNRLSDHEGKEIRKILEYAFYRLFNSNTNLLLLATVGRTRETAMPEIMDILSEDTDYMNFIKRKEN